jgi:hypothetical protein
MSMDDRRVLFWGCIAAVLIVLAAGAAYADEPKKPAPEITCEDVRQFVADNGRAHALAIALRNGATLKQLREAARCLRRG